MARSASGCLCLLLAMSGMGTVDRAEARQVARNRGARAASSGFSSSVPAGRWIGQDGSDFVGPSSTPGPSEVQDIHIALAGLPRDQTIRSAKVSPLGGGEWVFNGPYGPWRAEIRREAGSANAELYVEPNQQEDGRPFHVRLEMDDGRAIEFDVMGGRADPNLRMPGASLSAKWLGQDQRDRVGMGPSVGPDGLPDAVIALGNISRTVPVAGIEVRGAGGEWQSGVNLKGWNNAEFVLDPKDASKAELFLQADRELTGQALQILVRYTNNKTDSAKLVAGKFDPKRKVPKPKAPSAHVVRLTGRWLGQGGRDEVGPGDVHVTLSGLPQATIVAAVMNNVARGVWCFRTGEVPGLERLEFATPLAVHQDDSGTVDLSFPPLRDETGGKMTLRVILADGRTIVGEFPGGFADPGLRSGAGPGDAVTVARPGDDLQALVGRQGTVRLKPGRYPLKRPLILEKPVNLVGDAGATLVFSQEVGDPAWSAAIKILSGHTRLEGFAVRFASPVRWREGIDYGPAVIGATDNTDPGPGNFMTDVVFRKLDLEGPPASAGLAQAPGAMRLHRCASGQVEKCAIKGGTIELDGGPWRIADNRFLGTMPGTFSYGAISAHGPHDMVVKDNQAKPDAGSGKVWRFLILTGHGDNDLIEGNRIEGVGPRDDDSIPPMNAPEIILTESYSLHFEGKPLAIGGDGRVLVVPALQGHPVESGDVVSLLTGPHAGQWRRIAQTLGPTSFLMDGPLPSGDSFVSISTGFVHETIRKNRIDTRGSSIAGNLVLVGNLFGLSVTGNHLLGGNAFKITAAPSEHPVHWGWSHAPMLGISLENNIIEDSVRGGMLGVEHSEYVKASRGRVYGSAVVKGNVVRWSDEFRARVAGSKSAPVGIDLGVAGALDPGELVVTEADNRVEGMPLPAVRVIAARVNGKEPRDPSPPSAVPKSRRR